MPEYSPTKRELLEKYLRGQANLHRPVQAIPPRPQDQPIPLSYAQEQIWLHAQLAPEVPLYNEPVTIHYSGDLDVAALERSFNEVLRRHEAWRTCFPMVDGHPVQDVKPHLSISLPVVDLRNLAEDQRDTAALIIATQDGRKLLDLGEAPLFRARLMRLADREYRLYLTLSHIIFDGVAIYRVFLPELAALYRAYAARKPSPLGELSIQYPDYAAWQRESIRSEAWAEHIEYWRKQLGPELPVLDLPLDRPRPSVQTFRGSMYPFVLSASLAAGLKRIGAREGCTLFHTLLAGFAALLCRYSGQDDLPLGSVTAGRDRPELNPLLGYFLNTVVLRANVSGDPDFRELAGRMRNVTLEALDHESVPWGQLIQELNPPRSRSLSPFFQVLFSLEPPMPEVDPSWRLTQMDVDTGATKYDLYLELDERRDGVLARFHYATDLFDQSTIARMAKHWVRLLEAAAADPGLRVSQLPLLSENEKHQLLVEWNDTKKDYARDQCVHQCFEQQATRTPDSTAVVFEKGRLTYGELDRRANQLANYLLNLGVGADGLVGICLERSLDMVVATLGVLKAGAAYLPIDPAYPADRISFMLEDSEAPVLITQQRLVKDLPVGSATAVLIDSDWHEIARHSDESPGLTTRSENRCYVIYTSGSTGKPKGVEVLHRAVVNLLTTMADRPGMCARDRLLAVTTLSFDIAGFEIFLPLSLGASLEIASREVSTDGSQLLAKLISSGATVMQATPTTWRMLLEAGWQGSGELKVLCGGEVLSRKLAEELLQKTGSLWNGYGPTETTIYSVISKVEHGQGAVSIGRPIANTQIFILDKLRQPAPIGVAGELHIGGEGLARGYLNRPELSAEKFIANPFSHGPEARLYKTGDLARYLPSGDIDFLGRIDNQVKVRGFRIELGEIEAVLRQHPAVSEVVVTVREDSPEDQSLVAYFVPAQKSASKVSELRRFLKQKLPDYMVPASYRRLEQLPLLPSGKVDRKAVLAAGAVALSDYDGLAPPRTDVERKLAAMWQEVLKLEQVGIDQNFFELGGHSLRALQVMARIRSIFDVELPVRSLFEESTIAGLAAEVEKAQKLGLKARTPILPRRARTAAPSAEALLDQLDNLSATELQSLLQRVLDGKQPA